MPTAIAEYTPASSRDFNSRSRYSTASMWLQGPVLGLSGLLLSRIRSNRFASCCVLGENNIHFVIRLVLCDYKGIFGLPVGSKLQDLSREHRILQLRFFEGIADSGFVERTGSLDCLGHDAHAVIGRGRVPGINVMSSEGFVVGSKLFRLRVRQFIRPPDAGKNVIGTGAKRLAGIRFRTARSVAHHLVMQAILKVLAMHGDVIRQVRVRKENIRVAVFDLLQYAGKIGGSQFKLFIENYLEITGMLV